MNEATQGLIAYTRDGVEVERLNWDDPRIQTEPTFSSSTRSWRPTRQSYRNFYLHSAKGENDVHAGNYFWAMTRSSKPPRQKLSYRVEQTTNGMHWINTGTFGTWEDASTMLKRWDEFWSPGIRFRLLTLNDKGEVIPDEPQQGIAPSDVKATIAAMPPAPKAPILTTDKQARKEMPVARGVFDYFPNALAEVSHVSFVANEQHNPGQEMHWARGKSTDHADCIGRHLIERGGLDDDGLRHSAKLAWRALALLQEELEKVAGHPKV